MELLSVATASRKRQESDRQIGMASTGHAGMMRSSKQGFVPISYKEKLMTQTPFFTLRGLQKILDAFL